MANEYDEICSMLRKAGFEEDVLEIFRKNRIDKDTFVDLNNDDLLELNITALGDRKRIQKMKKNIQFGINHSDQRKRESSSPPEEDLKSHKKIRSDQGNYDSDFHYRPGDKLSCNTATGSGDKQEIRYQRWFDNAGMLPNYSLIDDCFDEDRLQTDFPNHQENEENLSSLDDSAIYQLSDSAVTIPNDNAPLTPKVATCTKQQSTEKKCIVPIKQNVPDKKLGWEDSFIVPKQYNEKVMTELSAGSITGVTRRAIIQDVAAMCLNHCKYPSIQQLEVVASKIVAAFPVLADTIGTGHGSWTTSLSNRLKNMRRNSRSSVVGNMVFKKQKELKATNELQFNSVGGGPLDCFTYERHKKSMKDEMGKKSKNNERISILMKETFLNRHQWIIQDSPTVEVVLKEFPCLQVFENVLIDFQCVLKVEKNLLDLFCVNWEKWFTKIIAYAKRDGKKATKDIIKFTDSVVQKDQLDPVVLLLLCKTLTQRPQNASEYLLTILGPTDDIGNVIQVKNVASPYIIGVGGDIVHISQYHIVCENNIMSYTFTSLRKAVVALFALYYIMNINYPSPIKVILSVIEKVFLEIQHKKSLPHSAIGTISAIEKLPC